MPLQITYSYECELYMQIQGYKFIPLIKVNLSRHFNTVGSRFKMVQYTSVANGASHPQKQRHISF